MSLSPSFWNLASTGLLLVAVSLVASPSIAAGTDFYVSPAGGDQNAGSMAKPWRTVQKAANSATPGSTVHVMAGTYPELVVVRVSGNATQGPITFQGEHAILDYSGRIIGGGEIGAFHIEGQSYLKIIGFEIRNYVAQAPGSLPVGIHVRGAAHHIEIRGNLIHHITNHINAHSNAHGIAVYGTGRTAATAIHNLIIVNNELHTLKLGASEALVVNGNVDGFTIDGNKIYDCNNIAIDAIGFEGTSVDPFDQARNGRITKNTITRIDSRGNPAYGNDRSANGIYIDGGTRITIDRNSISLCNIGIELASEHHGRVTSDITVTNNSITSSHRVGMSLGGFDARRGGTRNCLVKQNTLHGNDTDSNGNGELQLQYLVTNNQFRNNVFWSTSQNILISNPFATTAGNLIDYNTYFSPGGKDDSTWQWNNRDYNEFSTYRSITGNDKHSVFKHPSP